MCDTMSYLYLFIQAAGADPEAICEFSKFHCEKRPATMVGRRKKYLILDELKQS